MRNTNNRSDRTPVTIGECGEQGTIAAIRKYAPSTLNGDDAAVLPTLEPNSRLVCSTDTQVEGEHFRLDYSSPREIGAKAVVQNFADIQAMGARPTALLLAISAPPTLALSIIEDIAAGMNKTAMDWAAELVGGDITSSPTLTLTVTAIGVLSGPAPALTLDAAQPGQRVIASGLSGYSAAGLALLEHYGGRKKIPDDPLLSSLVQWHCHPSLTVGAGSVARASGATAMTDNSDGLIADLETIARRSEVSINLDSSTIAPDKALETAGEILGIDPWQWVLTGGEDHILMGTTSSRIPPGFHIIGEVYNNNDDQNKEGRVYMDSLLPPYRRGWESLS